MIANGAADFADTEEHKGELEEIDTSKNEGIDIGVVAGGILMTIIGLFMLGREIIH